MLGVLSKTICFLIMTITGIYFVGKVTKRPLELSIKSYVLIIISALLTVFLHPIQYTTMYSITIFILNILIYKSLYKITIEQSSITTSIFMVILFVTDLITFLAFRIFFTINEIRTDYILSIFVNIVTSMLSISIINIKVIIDKIRKFYSDIEKHKNLISMIFLILLIIGLCYLGYNITFSKIYDKTHNTNYIITIIFTILVCLFIQSRNNYNSLSDEYDTLFSYVQNFEDWIEKEQLNNHEYKNQLAVIRSITKDKKVINKINDILEDNINIKKDVVHKLKDLPKGGLKGIMYYKVAIAQKNKIHIDVDVNIDRKSIINRLNEQQMKTLSKLIGIYLDNAIEAAIETKKKVIIIEIYDLVEQTNIIISNTFTTTDNFHKRNEKGVSTKGEGRGNGLYYALNLINKNEWLKEKQEVVDDYYIQSLFIKKLD